MWPKKPKKDMHSNVPAMLIQHKKLKKQEIINRRPMKSKVCADKKCQATKYYKESDKNCQTNVMQPVKPPMDVWLKKSAMKLIGLARDKNCQAKISYTNQKKCKTIDSKSQISRNYGKNCQETINMCSVTQKTNMQLPKPAIRRLCKDKNCQSTRCYTKYDKNCQSANGIWRNYINIVIFICKQQ